MPITVLLADDNLIVREGVKSLLELEDDVDVVGQGADYDELVAGAEAMQPQGDRHRHPDAADVLPRGDRRRQGDPQAAPGHRRGDPVAVRRPDHAVALLSEGAAGYAYLLKDRVGEGDQLVRAVREVASGGSIGLPGKSGISGAVLALSPGKGGIAAFSPQLDDAGNSIGGQIAAQLLSEELGLDVFAARPA